MPVIRNAYRPGNFDVTISRPSFLQEIRAFMKRHNIPPATFGRKALNDPGFMERLVRAGGQCPSGTQQRVRDFMRKADSVSEVGQRQAAQARSTQDRR